MTETVWEDMISLNARDSGHFDLLEPARRYREGDTHTDWSTEGDWLDRALELDDSPLPVTKDREGYYGPHHFSYWASGLRDARLLRECCERLGVDLNVYLDLGCASGRVIRHFGYADDVDVIGCDINRRHVDWVNRHLPPGVTAFQNHSIPTLPLPDSSVDLVSAFSVFTHIEAFETSWLMELRRVLRPGGLAWITVHTERTWQEMKPTWPLFQALEKHPECRDLLHGERKDLSQDRVVWRWHQDRSYSSNVFYRRDYLYETWGRFMDIVEDHHRLPGFQDVLVMRRPLNH